MQFNWSIHSSSRHNYSYVIIFWVSDVDFVVKERMEGRTSVIVLNDAVMNNDNDEVFKRNQEALELDDDIPRKKFKSKVVKSKEAVKNANKKEASKKKATAKNVKKNVPQGILKNNFHKNIIHKNIIHKNNFH